MTEVDEIAATIENLPVVLSALLAPIDNTALVARPGPGEWSVHEVLGHLITGDVPAFRTRIAEIVAGVASIAPFDPVVPMADRDFNAVGLDELLDELADVRRSSAAFLRTLRPAELERTATYGADRVFAAGDFVHEWPVHDHDHLQQILANLKLAHVGGMTATMRRALELD